MRDALDVFLMGPREWRPLFTVPRLWRVETLFWSHYLARFPPLDIWLQTRGVGRSPDDFRYGETPYFTGLQLLQTAGVTCRDVFFDLGAGRGKMAFLTALHTGCRVVAVELLGGYNYVTRRIARWADVPNLEVRGEDFLRTQLSEATVVYLAGTTWSLQTRERLALRLQELPPGCRVISVTHRWPGLGEPFAVERHLFSWGRAEVCYYLVAGVGGEDDHGDQHDAQGHPE